jgi:hypothetical protein
MDNNPSFVYATYNKKIYIYNNIQLPQVESTNLIEVMEKRENTQELLEKIGLQGNVLIHSVNLAPPSSLAKGFLSRPLHSA